VYAKIKLLLEKGKAKEFCLKDDGLLTNFRQVCVLESEGLRKEIMSEAHRSPYMYILEVLRCIETSRGHIGGTI
jgi:hypothetical protein